MAATASETTKNKQQVTGNKKTWIIVGLSIYLSIYELAYPLTNIQVNSILPQDTNFVKLPTQ